MSEPSIARCLTIAGSDSGGGAGIQGDLKTFTVLGTFGMSAITALTAQNTLGVTQILEVPAEFVAEQIRVVLEDIGCEVIENQTEDYESLEDIQEYCVTIQQLTGKESNFVPYP